MNFLYFVVILMALVFVVLVLYELRRHIILMGRFILKQFLIKRQFSVVQQQ